MGVEDTATVTITCDNPACPGHPDLDPADRTGWLFISHEVYGEPTSQSVFGNYDCLTAASTLAAKGDGPMAKPIEPQPPQPEVDPEATP